jgi:hypothetical protein
MSFSVSDQAARHYTRGIQFVWPDGHGVKLHDLSAYPDEGEVVVEGPSIFEVTASTMTPTDTLVVVLKSCRTASLFKYLTPDDHASAASPAVPVPASSSLSELDADNRLLKEQIDSMRFELTSVKESAAAQIARLKDEITTSRILLDEAIASAAVRDKALRDLQHEVQAAADARAAAASRCAAEERLVPFLKFDRHYSTSPVPQFADELLAAVRKTIFKYCDQNGGEDAEARRFFKALQDEAFSHAQDLSDSIAVSACLIWTSQLRLTFRDGRSIEFCGILNRVLRDRVEDLLPDACVVVRAVNSMCVMRHDVSKLMYALR